MDAWRRWLLLLRVPLSLLGVVLFFALYNRFILDKNLQDLRTSLSVLDNATGAGQAEAALLLVDQALTTQMALEETDLKDAATLQYARGALSSDQAQRPVEDARAMLATLEESRSHGRSLSLRALDGIMLKTHTFFRNASLLPRQALGPALSPEIDPARLEEAARLENRGRHAESVPIYEALLSDYPNYSGRASLKLRLGRAIQRAGDLPRAERFYRDALAESRDPDESEAASRALEEISRFRKGRRAVLVLEKELASVGPGPERREKAFQLGTAAVKLQDLEKAAWAFGEAYRADPEGETAVSCLFKEGWALRALGRVDDAFDRFQAILRSSPNTPWAVMAYLQMAEAYKALGDPQAAAQFYEKATGVKLKDAAFTAMAYAQTACTYQFDLNNPEKAQFYFRESARLFPASPFSSVEKKIQEQLGKKNFLPSSFGRPGLPAGPAPPSAPARLPSLDPLAPGGPLLKLVEQFLPLFVETFSDRLSRYMQVAGEKQLTRRFTQEEFRALVVRRVQDKFPGKVTDVATEIHSDGFVGVATLRVGILSFAVRAKVGIVVRNDRPHTLIREITVGKIPLPDPLLKYLEERVNEAVDKKKYPLKVTQYELREGHALISVELIE